MNKKKEKQIIKYALSDDEIKKYIPNTKIVKYSDLKKYNNIRDLLPSNKSTALILYEHAPNIGHWTAIMRYLNKKGIDTIEFFDSLADDGRPDSELKWLSNQENQLLGQNIPYLTNLLNISKIPVIYNKFKFQSEHNKKDGKNINTCGRHCVLRIKSLLDCDYDLQDYYKFMKSIKKDSDNTYDQIVSHLTFDTS